MLLDFKWVKKKIQTVNQIINCDRIWTLIRKYRESIFLGSFVIKNVSLKKHIINTKTAVHMTDSSKRDGFC